MNVLKSLCRKSLFTKASRRPAGCKNRCRYCCLLSNKRNFKTGWLADWLIDWFTWSARRLTCFALPCRAFFTIFCFCVYACALYVHVLCMCMCMFLWNFYFTHIRQACEILISIAKHTISFNNNAYALLLPHTPFLIFYTEFKDKSTFRKEAYALTVDALKHVCRFSSFSKQKLNFLS